MVPNLPQAKSPAHQIPGPTAVPTAALSDPTRARRQRLRGGLGPPRPQTTRPRALPVSTVRVVRGYDGQEHKGGRMTDTYRLLIGGDLVDAASGETFDSIDPSTGEVFAAVARGGPDDARRAVEAARKAF